MDKKEVLRSSIILDIKIKTAHLSKRPGDLLTTKNDQGTSPHVFFSSPDQLGEDELGDNNQKNLNKDLKVMKIRRKSLKYSVSKMKMRKYGNRHSIDIK